MCSAVEQGDSIIMGKGSVFLCRAHFVSTIEEKGFSSGHATLPLGGRSLRPGLWS